MTTKITIGWKEIELISELKMKQFHEIYKLNAELQNWTIDEIDLTNRIFCLLCISIPTNEEKQAYLDDLDAKIYSELKEELTNIILSEKNNLTEKKKTK